VTRAGEPFVRQPRRFHDALRCDDVNHRQFLLGCFLAGEIDFRTGVVALTLRALSDGIGWEWSEDTLLRDLKALRPAWIDFEAKQGQRSPYVFRLTGLAVAGESETARLPHDFRTETPSPAEVTPRLRKLEQSTSPEAERDHALSETSFSGSPKKRTDEKGQENYLSEEELDHVLGKTTTRVRVVQAEDGSLEWSGEPQEGEQGLIDDCEALVDAGIATWVAT
jgi:hypothetical protein